MATSPALRVNVRPFPRTAFRTSTTRQSQSRATESTSAKTAYPPILIPESPLINLLSQLSTAQRFGIRNIRLTQALGYHCDRVFPDAEALYQWLTPGKRIISNHAWPAEACRCKWFRVPISGAFLLRHAEHAEEPHRLGTLVGEAFF